jgi:hypothetical protein
MAGVRRAAMQAGHRPGHRAHLGLGFRQSCAGWFEDRRRWAGFRNGVSSKMKMTPGST